MFFFYNFRIYLLNNMGWIQIRMDPELLTRSGTRKIQSWIRIRNTVNHSGSTTLEKGSQHCSASLATYQRWKFRSGAPISVQDAGEEDDLVLKYCRRPLVECPLTPTLTTVVHLLHSLHRLMDGSQPLLRALADNARRRQLTAVVPFSKCGCCCCC